MALDNFSAWLTVLNILIAFLGVAFLIFAIIEWKKARAEKENMKLFQENIKNELYNYFNAHSKITASYSTEDLDTRISLLEQAIEIEPKVYNGWNSLGYAYLEKEDYQSAIDAFTRATLFFENDPAALCDLAFAHLETNSEKLCLRYLQKTIKIDQNQKEIIYNNPQFKKVISKLPK